MQDDLTAAIHHYLTHAPASHFAQQPVEMGEQWPGEDNLLWRAASRGREVVVKLYADAGQARSRRQFDAHTLFAPLGFAPDPLWYDHTPQGVPHAVNVYGWVDGSPLAADSGGLKDLAQVVAAVHAADPGDLPRLSPHPANLTYFWRLEQHSIQIVQAWLAQAQLAAVAALYDRLAEAAAQLADHTLPLWSSAPAAAVHGDLRLDHAITGPDGLRLVDWDLSGLGDPALDVAQFLHRTRTLTDTDTLAAWLEHYLAAVDTPGLAQRIGVYTCLLPLHAATYLLLGLHQYAAPIPTQDLLDALPFLGETLAASLDYAAAALSVAWEGDVEELAQQVIGHVAP